jgi:undecaprenyl-phosphate 4-deoxy-4-formamido-L-arabinose transferase
MDEDGQHDARDIPRMLDTALDNQVPVVYARPTNPPPHGPFRNAASRLAKRILSGLSGSASGHFNSYRLLMGSTSRSVAAYAGSGVYLDIAIGWIASGFALTDVTLREEGGRASGYTVFSLFSHFWRMVLSSGTRALRVVSALGVIFALGGIALAIILFVERATSPELPEGWTSTIVVLLLGIGAILFSLGVIAEYVGVSVNMAMGRPPYLIVTDPGDGPLGRERARLADGEANAR